MKLSLEDVAFLHPDQLLIEFSPEEREQAWHQTQAQGYSNQAARWRAYLNCLCLNTFLSYLDTEANLTEANLTEPNLTEPNLLETGLDKALKKPLNKALVWPELGDLPSFWEVVNGTAVELNQMRLVLIPSEEIKFTALRVPREWVDIPEWASHYYVAMQLNLEECWLQVSGYTTYQQLRDHGNYDIIDETYAVDAVDLIEDLNVMWVTEELAPSPKLVVKPMARLSCDEATTLIKQLSQETPYSPRLDIPFAKWQALVSNSRWRKELYKQRSLVYSRKPSITLLSWLDNFLEAGWQTVEEIRARNGEPTLSLAYRSQPTRLKDRFNDNSSASSPFYENIPEAVTAIIKLLKTNSSKDTNLPAIELLGEIGHSNLEAIALLAEMINTTDDHDLRRQAAVSLGKLDPNHPQAGIRRVKIIDLEMQLNGSKVAFMVTFIPEADGEINVHLRVYPTKSKYLKPNLELLVLDHQGEIFLSAQSRSADNWIQLEFNGEKGDRFMVKLVLGDASFSKEFVL
ncbi:MAG: DUF1822 family protein [Moorea sp. SIO4G2]|nr:DUF1822 family protein [Moorena sp. SIO4G2]